MRKLIPGCYLLLVVSLAFSLTAAEEYAGYLSVNDEDYGYWESRPMVLLGGEPSPLDEYSGSTTELALELGHDLAQGLVRQYSPQSVSLSSAAATATETVQDAAGAASGYTPSRPPRGGGEWVFLHEFLAFGFGQYEGSEATHHVYCDRAPAVWAWLAGDSTDGASPDEIANRLIENEHGMARLKIVCDKTMAVTR